MRATHPSPSATAARALAAILLLALAGSAAAAGAAPELESSESLATAGYYRLSWRWPGDEEVRFELQESFEPGFARAHTVYLGYDRATLLSGRSDGTYYYRIRRHPVDGEAGPWSPPLEVRVEHHPLGRAMAFFWVGAAVFAATLLLIIGGGSRERRRRRRRR